MTSVSIWASLLTKKTDLLRILTLALVDLSLRLTGSDGEPTIDVSKVAVIAWQRGKICVTSFMNGSLSEVD